MIADGANDRMRRLTHEGKIITVAGSGPVKRYLADYYAPEVDGYKHRSVSLQWAV